MGVKIPIIQVVGYQNSGKTTLVTKLVEQLSDTGCKVGTIKHHGHGGAPTFGDDGKDTMQHRQAGASVVSVEGAGILQLTAQPSVWDLQKTISLYEQFKLDAILVEGYKMENFPKVVLFRSRDDLSLLEKVSNILCVVSAIPLTNEEKSGFTFFLRGEEEIYIPYIMKEMKGLFDNDKII